MKWIENFDLFMLDFDGLLVDTERLHFSAYQKLCASRGYLLPWDFEEYIRIAHASAHGIKEALEPCLGGDWHSLYAEKKKIYLELLLQGKIQLVDGVEPFLRALADSRVKRCVVTHSPKEQVELIKGFIPILQTTIPVWITREDYEAPKPAPDGYFKAMEVLADPGDRVIGFEDSMRGLLALEAARATAVLICDPPPPRFQQLSGVYHFNSFRNIPKSFKVS